MGQKEIYNLLLRRPRLHTREIAEVLGWNRSKVSMLLSKLRKSDVKFEYATPKEKQRLMMKYPTLKNAAVLKVYMIKNA